MTDFASWQRHIDHVIATQGRWLGIGDGDGNPLFDLPLPQEFGAADQWNESTNIEVTVPTLLDDGSLHRAAQRLIMDGIIDFDHNGQLPPAEDDYTILSAVAGENGVERKAGMIIYSGGHDPENRGVFTQATFSALDSVDVWHTIMAQSWPAAWWKAAPYPQTSDESGIVYPRSWDMARVEMATRSTFTFKYGQAGFVIRRLAQEALDAAMMAQTDPDGTRWVDDPGHIVEVPEVDNSPTISLEARDGTLWDTCIAQAQNAGVLLGTRIWWPGDPPIRSWECANSSMTAAQVDLTPSQGEAHRKIIYQTFDHPMIVLTVTEVG